ncbi:MAG: hypothetical protein HZA14_03070 [Nitrospirae bacterium]|nr:hypothetical protein [Nitrospirota bacterium]
MHELMGKQVEVHTAEIVYRGILVELGETEIHLQSDNGWIVIRVDRIVDVRLIE